MTLTQSVAGFYHWLREHNVDTTGVRLVVSFPTAVEQAQADMAFRREFEKLMMEPGASLSTKHFELHGLQVRFDNRRDR